MTIVTLGIDLGKTSCSVAGLDGTSIHRNLSQIPMNRKCPNIDR
jgi:molecular chaperone DnaK (HSP70)